jgi:hypothetical protein
VAIGTVFRRVQTRTDLRRAIMKDLLTAADVDAGPDDHKRWKSSTHPHDL